MPSSRTAPAVVVAGLLTAALWVLTGQLADWLRAGTVDVVPGAVLRAALPHPGGAVSAGEPLSGATILAAALAGGVGALGTYLALRRLPSGTGRWATFLAVWFSVVAASALAGSALWFAGITLPWTAQTLEEFVAAAFGGYWGLANGVVVAVAVAVTRDLVDRHDDPAGTRHTRTPVRVRAWPAALSAGLATGLLWAGAGIARTLVPVPVDPQTSWGIARDVVLLPAARIAVDRDELLAHPVPLVLPVVAGLVVAVLTGLATRRLPPAEGRWPLLLAVWLACVLGSALTSVVPLVVSAVQAGGALPDAGRTLPVLEAGMAWGLVCGVFVALLAVVVHGYAGPVRTAGEPADEPWPAPSGTTEESTGAATTGSGPAGEPAPTDEGGTSGTTPDEARERDEVPANA
jgi:hypothetical protein